LEFWVPSVQPPSPSLEEPQQEQQRQPMTNKSNEPQEEKNKQAKYHCTIIVGTQANGLMLRNSWGVAWGTNGHCIFPYEHVSQYAIEVWCILNIDMFENP
jgi:hypothetical protein